MRMPLRAEEYRAGAIVDLDRAVVDERQAARGWPPASGNCVVLILVELPDVGQRAERDVEVAVGPLADLPRDVQHLAHLRRDRHRAALRPPR